MNSSIIVALCSRSMPDTNNHIGPRYSRIKIYAADKSRGSSSYRSISDARARPQQQTHRPQLLLSIDGTDRRTERTRPFYDSRSTQPYIPPGSLNRVPASAGVRAGMLQVTLCDLMWHVSSRSGVATLRTAIHLLLTYLLTYLLTAANQCIGMSTYRPLSAFKT